MHGPRSRLVVALLSLAGTLTAQRFASDRQGLPERSERRAAYTMRVRLDPARKTVTGRQTIRYRNATRGTTGELRFHLYLNAFKNLRSSHLRQSQPEERARYASDDEFGQVRFTALRLVRPATADLLASLRHRADDDGNADDQTVGVVPLPRLLSPGQEIELETAFEAKLPKAYRRTGWGPGNFFMLAQWFPKLGVLEEPANEATDRAVWSCHQFHAWTEFYADFATYDVTLETPKGWPVGATGAQVGATEDLGDYEARRFVQDDVHDFAWVTDPDYRVYEHDFVARGKLDPTAERWLLAAGWQRQDLALRDVAVRLLLHPEHATLEQRQRHLRAVDVALAFYGSRFGAYPYPTLTVVDPVTDALGRRLGGGMEYPTLITCGTRYVLHARRLVPEGVTVHEFGHQFWYGLAANNEFEHAWVDEGINTYAESRAQDLAYMALGGEPPVGDPMVVTELGPFAVRGRAPAAIAGIGRGALARATQLARLDLGPLARRLAPWTGDGWLEVVEKRLRFEGVLLPDLPVVRYLAVLPFLTFESDVPELQLYDLRTDYLRVAEKDPIVKLAWTYFDRESYGDNSYDRPATVLATLERMMGPDKWWPCLRRFHERSRFAHPTSEDFLATVAEFGGEAVAAFAREAFHTTKRLDYGIDSVTVVEEPAAKGLFDSQAARQGRGHETVVTVRRLGDLVVPVTIRFDFAKGSSTSVDWPAAGQGEWRRFTFGVEEIAERGALRAAWVDPPRPEHEVGVGPAGVYVLDADLLNNAWRAAPDRKPARRHALRLWAWTQTVLSFFGGLG